MELTESWQRVLPQRIRDRYSIAETRNAAAILASTNPDEYDSIRRILDSFELTLAMLLTKGGNKTLVATTLDLAFREEGWREAQYKQTMDTYLHLNPYHPAGEHQKTVRHAHNEAEGHQVDNVRGRIALDVEWNAKDGNLDRDISNFRALYEAGQIDVAVLITRTSGQLRDLASSTIAAARQAAEDEQQWEKLAKLNELAKNPLGSTTTTNMDKLLPRMSRGDAAGCPMLAVAITERCYLEPANILEEAAAARHQAETDDDN